MSLLNLLNHLLNFAAPALVLALLLPRLAPFVMRKRAAAMDWRAQSAINFAVGLAVLLASLWGLGRDGKMAAYAGLVLAVATSQWLLARGWRK